MSRSSSYIGTLVQQLREAAGWTRVQLAADTGIPAHVLAELEQGRQSIRPWIVHRLLKSQVMSQLQDKARSLGFPVDRGPLCVGDALALYGHAVVFSKRARRDLRQYFAPVLAAALADWTTESLDPARQESSEVAVVIRPTPKTAARAMAFLEWCTRRGWLPANPLRTNGAQAVRPLPASFAKPGD